MSKYEKFNSLTSEKVESSTVEICRDLDEIARLGALRMLGEVLEAEVEEFLGRKRHERRAENRLGVKLSSQVIQTAMVRNGR